MVVGIFFSSTQSFHRLVRAVAVPKMVHFLPLF